MNVEKEVVTAHPEGEVEIAEDRPEESATSIDTFAGKIHVKWVPEAAVSSLGLMPYFIEFLKTSGRFDKWVEDCPLHYSSGNAPEKRNILGTLVLSVLAGHWRYAHINAIRGDGINPELLGMTRVASEDSVRRGMKAMDEAGVGPEATVMIGDTSFDMAMAMGAEVGAIGVGWGYHATERLIEAGAHAVVTDGAHLLDAIELRLRAQGVR